MFMNRCLMYNQPAEWLFTTPGYHRVHIFSGVYYANGRGAGGAFASNRMGEMGYFFEADEIVIKEPQDIVVYVGEGSTTAAGEPSYIILNNLVYGANGGANGSGNRAHLAYTVLDGYYIERQDITNTPPLAVFQSATSYDWEDKESDKVAYAAPSAGVPAGNGYIWLRKKRELTGMKTPGAFEYTSPLDPYKFGNVAGNKYFDYDEGSVDEPTNLNLSFGTLENPNKVHDVLNWVYRIPNAVYAPDAEPEFGADDILVHPPMYAWGLGIDAAYKDVPLVYTNTLELAEDTKIFVQYKELKLSVSTAPDSNTGRYYMAKIDSTTYLPHFQQGAQQSIVMQRQPSQDVLE